MRFGTYRIDEHRKLMRACADAQTRKTIRCSYTPSMAVDEDSGQNLDTLPRLIRQHWRLKRVFRLHGIRTDISCTGPIGYVIDIPWFVRLYFEIIDEL